ncbi:MAG: hypothetical protein K0S04_3542 [Herbinix sp.]|jgi:similar to spore coat protein|nr:hypothetical protein [Herbinix sp.]
MIQENLSPNELMQIHEMLNLKTVCAATSKMMEGVVFDQDLKALLEKDAKQSIQDLQTLQGLCSKAPKMN